MIPENKPKNGGPKLPKFNIYWIYGLIAIVFIVCAFLPNSTRCGNTFSQRVCEVDGEW